jgi:NAD(P)-dependent dehydrogenase (short-subunit alcohol dehydrogenase family)
MQHANIAIFGASGGLGAAFVRLFAAEPSNTVHAFSRTQVDFALDNVYSQAIDFLDEDALQQAALNFSADQPLDLIIVATGLLHDGELQPEKSLRQLSVANFEKSFLVNTIGPAMVAKHLLPKLSKDKRAVFAVLSARVGSISDNRLGGWYAYRAAKAALNMLIKSISIEVARRQKQAIIVGLHPGTVNTRLSEPFQSRVPSGSLFTSDHAVQQLAAVLDGLEPEDTGKVFAWDGQQVPS